MEEVYRCVAIFFLLGMATYGPVPSKKNKNIFDYGFFTYRKNHPCLCTCFIFADADAVGSKHGKSYLLFVSGGPKGKILKIFYRRRGNGS